MIAQTGAWDLALQWLRSWSPVLSGLGSLVLTAGLVYLYFRQTRLQDRQTGLQERQQRLLEAQAEPVVDIGSVDVEGDRLYVTLANAGGGIATDLEVVTTVEFSTDEGVEPVETGDPLSQMVTEEYGDAGIDVEEIGQSLRPYEPKSTFVATPHLGLRLPDGSFRQVPFQEGIRELAEHGVEELGCRVSIEHTNLFGETRSDVAAVGGGLVEPGTVFAELVGPVDRYR